VLAAVLLCAAGGLAQKTAKPASPAAALQSAQAPAAAPEPPPDPLGRSTPHGCVVGFLLAAQKEDYARATQYLDVKKPPDQAEELARQLQQVLDTGLSANLDSLSREPQGNTVDNMRTSRELVGTVKTSRGSVDILLDRVQRPGATPIWLFSAQTLAAIPQISGELQGKGLEQRFPRWMVETRLFSLPLWRWALLLVSQLVILLAAWLIGKLTQQLLGPIIGRVLPGSGKEIAHRLQPPIFILLLAISVRLAAGYSLSVLGRQYWSDAAVVLAIIGVAWLILRASDIAVAYVMHEKSGGLAVGRATFLAVAQRVFKIIVLLCAFLGILSHAGVNVSAMLAGLGIGGIALALAAQNTLQDFFGGIAIVARKAIRVGDLCKIGSDTGTVEDIGLSSLKLRTADRCVVSLPNSKVAQAGIQNFSLRDKYWVHEIFNVRYDTTAGTLSQVIAEIDRVLQSTEAIEKESARVRLIDLNSAGLQLEISAYLLLPPMDGARCLAAQEKIYLEVLKILEAAGTGLAIPGQTAGVAGPAS